MKGTYMSTERAIHFRVGNVLTDYVANKCYLCSCDIVENVWPELINNM